MRWLGEAHRLDKSDNSDSDIDVKHLSHLADTIARSMFFYKSYFSVAHNILRV